MGSGTDIDLYLENGRRVAEHIVSETEKAGRPIRELDTVLDFACGCGRVLHHLVKSGPRFAGCDVDRRAITWLKEATPAEVIATGPSPPLPFDDESFDLIYTISSFTHFSETDQDAWLRELARLLRRGGIFIATTNGQSILERFQTEAALSAEHLARLADRNLGREGFVFEPYANSVASRGSHTNSAAVYGLAFHTQEYVREHWGQVFSIRQIYTASTNSGQDLIVATAA